jgi:predicted transcriptional regulator
MYVGRGIMPHGVYNGKGYQPQRIHDRYKRVIDLKTQGLTHRKIAEALDITPMAVSYILDSDVVQEELSKRHGEVSEALDNDFLKRVRERIEGPMTDKALCRLEEVLDDENPHGAPIQEVARTARDVLDRAGAGAIKRVETRAIRATITSDDLADICNRAEAADIDLDEILDVEAEEVENHNGGNGTPKQLPGPASGTSPESPAEEV